MREIQKIAEIHQILFESLCYFDDFCRQHNIRYYLSNGTLLGAAKYGAFIPWDDDADILVPREDYDRLVTLTQINDGKHRLLCREQVPTWRMPYAKLSREDTVIKEGEYDFGTSFGLSLDIFPLDTWSSCLPIAKIQAVRGEILKRMLICSIGKEFATKKNGVKKLILKTIWHMGQAMGHEKILKKYSRILKRAKKRRKKRYLGCLIWTSHMTQEVLPASFFESTETLEFCGRPFTVFSAYESYLDRLYSNWREELPLEQQHSNHDVKVWRKDAE